MQEKDRHSVRGPGFVVLRHVRDDEWQLVGEAERQPGRTARAARAQAILDATNGRRVRARSTRPCCAASGASPSTAETQRMCVPAPSGPGCGKSVRPQTTLSP